jgi:hypothetical protein
MYMQKKVVLFLILVFGFSLNVYSGGLSESSHLLQTYKNRLAEVEKDNTLRGSGLEGIYAAN